MTDDMGFDLKLPAVGELTLPQWQDWLVRYNAVLTEREARIEKLEAALRVYAEEDHWSGDTFEPIRFPEGECVCCYEHFSDRGEIARKALEGK